MQAAARLNASLDVEMHTPEARNVEEKLQLDVDAEKASSPQNGRLD